MIEGSEHRQSDEECPYSWLNEWLCEYVDGTMDPSLRNNFEEYLAANPALSEHVECLQRTRDLLSKQNEGNNAHKRLQRKLIAEQDDDLAGDEKYEDCTSPGVPVYQVMGGMVGMFVMGMAVGAFFLGNAPLSQEAGPLSEAPDLDVQYEESTPPVSFPAAEAPFSSTSDWGIERTNAAPVFNREMQLAPTFVDTSVSPATHLSDRR